MKLIRFVCAAAVVAVPLIGVAPVAGAHTGHGAQKVTMYDVTASPTAWACDKGVTDTTHPTASFVVWNLDSTGVMHVTVAVKRGTPKATYNVWVESNGVAGATCPNGTTVPSNPGAVVTNGKGNGTGHFSFAALPGAGYWLTAWAGAPAGGHNGLRTQIVKLS